MSERKAIAVTMSPGIISEKLLSQESPQKFMKSVATKATVSAANIPTRIREILPIRLSSTGVTVIPTNIGNHLSSDYGTKYHVPSHF